MTADSARVLEPLENPPIVEAVCGFHFDPPGGLDAMALGEFRAQLRGQFPSHQLLPPLSDGPISFAPAGGLRLLMTSEDTERVVQVQTDRLYFNWRRVKGGEYPRFSDHAGGQGVRSLAIGAFEQFREFCVGRFGQPPVVRKCELTKINHLVMTEHWRNADDLADLLPPLGPWLRLGTGELPGFQCILQPSRTDGEAVVTARSAIRWNIGGVQENVVVIEIRFQSQRDAQVTLQDSFDHANVAVDELFVALIPKAQHHRFTRKN